MRYRISLGTFLILASALSAGAGDREVRDFRFVKETTPALSFSNAAALGLWTDKISVVEVESTKGNGAAVPLEGSKDDFSVRAGTESFFRISDRLVFHGKLSWSDFQGKEMGGPILMDPDLHPVNFLESDENTVGVKKRELYGLVGALALRLGEKWFAGLEINYESGDQTKVKDPRFSNVLMDLGLSGGIAYRPSDQLLLGASLHYRDLLEQIRGGIYGTADLQYFIQTDKGGFLGSVAELTGDYNYVPSSSYRPMVDRYYGISFQALVANRFSNELTFRYRDGYYGKKASSSPVFFDYSGIEGEYEGVCLLPAGRSLHRMALTLGLATLGNAENVLRYVTPPGQNTIVEYTGENNILDRIDWEAALDYRWYRDTEGARPGSTLGLKAGFRSRNQTTTLYPFYRNHSFSQISLDLYGQKCWTWGPMSFILDVSATGLAGFGTDKEDGSYASGTTSGLKSFDNYLGRYFEFKTAPRAGASLGLTVARRIKGGFEPYLRLSDSFLSLLAEPQYLQGRTRNVAALSIGCNF